MSLERRYHTDAVRIKPKHHAEVSGIFVFIALIV